MTSHNYLQKMGVTVWHLRAVRDACYFQCVLHNAIGKAVGCIVADIDDTISIVAQENLLQKIASALTESMVIDQRVLSGGLLLENPGDFIVLLGNINIDDLKIRTIHSFSLADLINHADHKKLLWMEMKTLKVFFDV